MNNPIVEKGAFQYENQFFSLQDVYRILGFSTTPTDRELEAKIISFMRKYNGYNSDSDDRRLYDFFDRLYDHLFDTEEQDDVVEGFVARSAPNSLPTSVSSGGSGGEVVSSSSGSSGGATGSVSASSASGGSGSSGGIGGASGSVVQTVSNLSYSRDTLNPILKQTVQRVISIDSRYRNLNNTSNSTNRLATNFTIELSEPLRDVLSLKLYSYQIPFTWYTVNKDFGSNFFIIKGNVPGLTDEYRIEITPGNYSATTLTDTINTAIQNVALEYSDVSFGNTRLSYNTATTVATFTIDIQKSFQESQFELDWVNWSSPWNGINRDSSNNNILNIPQYLGFDYQTYNLNSIYSVRGVLPLTFISATDDIRASIYKIFSGGINGTDFSNNYFTVVSYVPTLKQVGSVWSVNSYADVSNNPAVVKKTITITLDLAEGGYSRNQLVTEIQTQLRLSPYFLDSGSSLARYDQTNGLHSFFQLSLVLDRKQIPFVESSKTVVIFPDESGVFQDSGYSPIWTGVGSCFLFDPDFTELNDVVAEYPLFPANYVIQGVPYVKITVNTTGYTNNTIKASVAKSSSDGYTYDQYITEINNAFSTDRILINDVSNNGNTFGLLTFVNQTPFYFDTASSLPCFTFDFNYELRTQDFVSIEFKNDITLNETPFLLKFKDGAEGTDEGDYTKFLYSTNGHFTFELSQSIPTNSAYNFYIPENHVFLKINPNLTNPTGFVPIFLIPFKTEVDYTPSGGYYPYSDFDTFVGDLLKSITGYNTDGDSSFPLKSSSVTKRKDVQGAITYYQIDFNIVVSKIITQQDCSVEFYDMSGSTIYNIDNSGNYQSGAPRFSWGSYLNFTDRSYNLGTTIRGNSPIQASTLINIDDSNRNFYFRPQGYADGLVTGVVGDNVFSGYNDILITINRGSYSINSLFDSINQAFSVYDSNITRGTQIYSVSKMSNGETKNYCVLRTNINRSFYSKDYALDFYDLSSFVKCYVGSSVRNTTWDSTIGWILGFHDKTIYELNSYTPVGTTMAIDISGELSVNTNLFSYFLISVDDFNQNRLNDGLVTITRPEQQVSLSSYSAIADITTDFSGNVGTSGSSLIAENNLTAKQMYSINQVLEARKNTNKIYSQGPFVKDIFGYIPLKLPSTPGDTITEYGGTLQNQDRLYFGPVNIRRLQVQLINDKGTIMDLNGADWSFSFICEQLYQKKVT